MGNQKKSIKKWLTDLFLKTTAGDSTYVATMISIFVLVALFAALFFSFARISSQNRIERTYRQYLLVMETKGCLTPSAKAQLIADLTALGLENIDLTGTSESPVAYGGTVTLRIRGDLSVDAVRAGTGSGGGRILTKGREVVHIDVTKTGTALY